jgi:isoleucyl-tRNA synthetase
MSKSLRNYPDPMEVFDSNGADAMRWYLLSSPILRGTDFSVTAAGLRDTARQVLLPMWNAWYFLTLYANAAGIQGVVRDGVERPFSTNVLDRYVLAKTRDLVEDVTRAMEAYDLFGACATVRSFVETLTNWYIRRSRQRFWDGDRDAVDTLHTVLDVLVRVAAPLLPFVAEEIYGGLHGDVSKSGYRPDPGPSAHLADWPRPEDLPGDETLVRTMDEVRDVCSATLSVRKAHGRRVRQPLATVTVAAPDADALRPFVDIIADEVNVREVVLTDDVESVARHALQVVPSVIGPRLGPDTQDVIRAVREGRWVAEDDAVVAGGHRLDPGEFVLTLQTDDDAASAPLSSGVGVVVLNVDVTPELEIEGQARDLVRMVQQARRDRDLAVTDRISLRIRGDERWALVVRAHEKFIADETLAVSLDIDDSGTDAPQIDIEVIEDWQRT